MIKRKRSKSKKSTRKKNLYLPILNSLRLSTNLTKIGKELCISKQRLNYYLRELRKKGFVYNKGNGWWEVTEKGKNPTKYSIFINKDSSRGHAYIWETEIEVIPKNWDKRNELLEKKGINFKLVGALKTTPRIKVLGRKVWLCNNHLRIFDKEKSSYYGDDAKESRKNSKLQAMRIVHSLQNKLGIKLNPNEIKFRKEHYALIKNDLAIDQNQKGILWRIKDENNEEWLLIDDSLEQGGELENVGKSAYKTNIPMQKWWNEHKETKFKVTPALVLNGFKVLTENQQKQSESISEFAVALNKHIPAYEGMTSLVGELKEEIKSLKEEIKGLKK